MKLKNRRFTDLTNNEVEQIIKDIFEPTKITCLKKHKKDDMFSCKIYTEWETDSKSEEAIAIDDELEIGNPWTLGSNALYINMSVDSSDYIKLKQFCIAKGVLPDWVADNPYLEDANLCKGSKSDASA